ncbi:hypothetical protein ACX80O_02370 [Arthrobacter sp. Hz1]
MSQGPEVRVELDPGSLRKLVLASRTWDKVARRELRQNLRAAAQPAVDAVQREVLGTLPPKADQRRQGARRRGSAVTGTYNRNRGEVRAALAAGVKTAIRTGRVSQKTGDVTGEGVRITAAKSKLPVEKQPMLYLYGRATFRHPVFGDREVWVNQHGKPWFYKPLRRYRAQYQRAVVEAIDKASKEIGNA